MNLIVKANASKQQKQQKLLNYKRKTKEKHTFNLEKIKESKFYCSARCGGTLRESLLPRLSTILNEYMLKYGVT